MIRLVYLLVEKRPLFFSVGDGLSMFDLSLGRMNPRLRLFFAEFLCGGRDGFPNRIEDLVFIFLLFSANHPGNYSKLDGFKR